MKWFKCVTVIVVAMCVAVPAWSAEPAQNAADQTKKTEPAPKDQAQPSQGAQAQVPATGQNTAMARCEARFDAIDTNKDGKVSLEEFKARHPGGARAEQAFKARDFDQDGFLSKEELCRRGARRGPRGGAAPQPPQQ